MSKIQFDLEGMENIVTSIRNIKNDMSKAKRSIEGIALPDDSGITTDIKTAISKLSAVETAIDNMGNWMDTQKNSFMQAEAKTKSILMNLFYTKLPYRLQSEVEKRERKRIEEERLRIKKSIADQKLIQYGISEEIRPILEEAMMNWSNLSAERQDVVLTAAGLISKGCTYSQPNRQPGNKKPTYLDCSSYVAWTYRQTGHSDVPLDAYTGTFIESNNFKKISEEELVPGDIGLFNESMAAGNDNHIGIYAGKNNDNQKVWLHCTSGKHTGINGPQVATRDNPTGSANYITTYRQYQNWKEVGEIQQEGEQPPIISTKNVNDKIDVKDVVLKKPTLTEEKRSKRWKQEKSSSTAGTIQVDLNAE